MNIEQQAVITASKMYLTEPLPENYTQLPSVRDYVEEYAWCVFDTLSGDEIWDEIIKSADLMLKFAKQYQGEI